jgi:hypothetical protein
MQVIGACGLNCSECQAFKATKTGETEKLAELAKAWGKPENPYTVEDMMCQGCMSETVYKGCTTCGIRNCALTKGVENCGGCNSFPCGNLENTWKDFKLNTVDMRRNLGNP